MKTTLLISCATFSVVVAGCGGSTTPHVANNASSSAATRSAPQSQNALVAFSQCMRSNGVTNFPDPQHFAGGNVKLTIHGIPGSPKLKSALQACSHLLPSGPSGQQAAPTASQLAGELSFARCMRSHGLSRFPDPNGQGQLSIEMVQAQGIDVHSPAVLHVVQTCLPASHGWLTAAKVREALANACH
jgi:hypothetical protein